jgi:hypothetical protein
MTHHRLYLQLSPCNLSTHIYIHTPTHSYTYILLPTHSHAGDRRGISGAVG